MAEQSGRKLPKNKQPCCLIVRNAYAHDFGGGERFPVDLAKTLLNEGLRAVVVSRSSKLLDYAHAEHVPSHRGWWWSQQNWGGIRTLFFPLYIAWQVILTIWYIALIVRFQARILHLQSRDDFIAGTLAGRLLGRRVIWTDHADLKYIYANHSVWYKNPIGKITYTLSKLAHAVTLVSDNERKQIESSLGYNVPHHYAVAYMGAPAQQITPHKRSAQDKQAVILGATSRLVTAKGIGELIIAFKHVDNPKTRLWLFGEGPEADHFKRMASGDERIVFWGFPTDSLNYLAACDIFVHPSYHEGFSLSLVEAAKLSLPIIACDTGGNPELIKNGHNGILVPVKDATSLAAAMVKLIDNPGLRKSYGQAGRHIYEEKFIFETAVKERFLPLYG